MYPPILYRDTSPLLDHSPLSCRITRGRRVGIYASHTLCPGEEPFPCFITPEAQSLSSFPAFWVAFSFVARIAVMSSSPEAEKLEQSLLDGCVHAEYVGRRPSSSGRDTKRISALPCNPFVPYIPLNGLAVSGLFSLTRSRELCDAFGKYFPTSSRLTTARHLPVDRHATFPSLVLSVCPSHIHALDTRTALHSHRLSTRTLPWLTLWPIVAEQGRKHSRCRRPVFHNWWPSNTWPSRMVIKTPNA